MTVVKIEIIKTAILRIVDFFGPGQFGCSIEMKST
jgi:hypothetical protein